MVNNIGAGMLGTPGQPDNNRGRAVPGTPGTDSDRDRVIPEDLLPEVELTDHPLAEDPFRDWADFLSSEAAL